MRLWLSWWSRLPENAATSRGVGLLTGWRICTLALLALCGFDSVMQCNRGLPGILESEGEVCVRALVLGTSQGRITLSPQSLVQRWNAVAVMEEATSVRRF